MRYTVTFIRGNASVLVYSSASPLKELSLIDPTLHLEADAAGSFEAIVPHTNVGYGHAPGTNSPIIEKLRTYVRIHQGDANPTTIWVGRVLSTNSDFNNQISIYCEGTMSFLADTTQPQIAYPSASTPAYVVWKILDRHNSRCNNDRRRINVGNITMPANIFADNPFFTNYGTSLEAVEDLRDKYGGHMRIRYANDAAYLDWFETYDETIQAVQSVDFGVNLLDFAKTNDGSTLVNSVMPLGKVVNNAGAVVIGDEIPLVETDSEGKILFGPEHDSLAWGNGARIVSVSGAAEIQYELESGNTSTGFWDSGLARETYGTESPNTSLEVHPGEVYYINSVAHGDTAHYVVTEGRLGNNPAYVLASKIASDKGQSTALEFYKLTVPESRYGGRLFLNVCAYKSPDVGIGPPIWPWQLQMSIYRSRIIPDGLGERITLKGLADGAHEGYLDGDGKYVKPTPIQDGTFVYNSATYSKNGYNVEVDESVSKYGRIEKILTFDDVVDPEALKILAANYLSTGQFENITISVTALDLALLDSTVNSPNVLDPIHVCSTPHLVDLIAPVMERDIPLNDPAGQTYEIGFEKSQRLSDVKNWIRS